VSGKGIGVQTLHKWETAEKVPTTRANALPEAKIRRDSQGSLPKNAFLAYLNEKTTEL
jgi:hypothetical protein